MATGFDYGLNAKTGRYDGIHKYLRITDIDDGSRVFLQNNLTSPIVDYSDSADFVLKPGDIVFARTGASTGKTYMYHSKDGLSYFAGFLIRAHTNNDSDVMFFYQSTLTKNFSKFIKITSQRSGQPGINSKEYANYELKAPKLKEQEEIGIFLTLIDNVVALHERKLELLKKLKKAYLQQLFPENGSKVPELRFASFTSNWQQRQLNFLLRPSSQTNKDGQYDQSNVLAASLGTELTKKHIFFGLRSTKESVKKYKIVKPGDVIYTKSPIKGYPNGIVRSNKSQTGIVPSLYCVYEPSEGTNSDAIQNYFEDQWRLNSYLYPLVNVGARNNVNITDTAFLEGKIWISSEKAEQSRIVSMIEAFNQRIIAQETCCKILHQLKEAYLQKLFV